MKTRLILIIALLAFSKSIVTAAPLGTAFTYQGQLASGASAANGFYDFQFTVFDVSRGGGGVAGPVTCAATGVTNGLFTVSLDFGGGVFTGDARWLEIGLRTNGSGAFTTLSPRQPLAPTPYALYAPSAGLAASAGSAGSVAAANIIGTMALAQLPAAVLTNNNSGVSLAGDFSGNGGSLTNLDSRRLTGPLTVEFAPAKVGENSVIGWAFGVALRGAYAFVANNLSGLAVYFVYDPASPTLLGNMHEGGNGLAMGVAVAGNYAYLANYTDGLRIYDISDMKSGLNPSIGHISNGGNAIGVAVDGHYVYLANNADGLRIYDVLDPANPTNVAHVFSGGRGYGVAVSGHYAYLANYDDGLRMYDIANPASPASIGHINSGGKAYGVAVSGHYAYVANYDDGLRIYDISDPANPIAVGHANDGGLGWGVAVAGNYVYLANYDDGARIYDVVKPSNPVSAPHLQDVAHAYGVAVAGDYAYFVGGTGLSVYSLTTAVVGNGSQLTHLNAAALQGTIPGATLPKNVALVDGPYQIFNGANEFLNAGNVFVGNGAGLTGLNADSLSSGTIPEQRIYGTYSQDVHFTSAYNSFQGAFSGNGGLLTNLNASSLTIGAIPDQVLRGNYSYEFAFLNYNNNFWGSFHGDGSGLTGIGISSPPDNSITSAKILDGTIQTVDIASIDAGKIVGGDLATSRLKVGGSHTLSADYSTIAGGWGNTIESSAFAAAIGGGSENAATGPGAMVPGGNQNIAGEYSFAAGRNAQATNRYSFVWNDGSPPALNSTNDYSVTMRADGGYRLFSASYLGVSLPPGGGSWVSMSDRHSKANLMEVNPQAILKKVAALPLTTWNYKSQDASMRHIGPMAQDFKAAFGVGESDTGITTVDADGVALAAIQGLNQKVEEQRAENAKLKQRLERLEQLLGQQAGGAK